MQTHERDTHDGGVMIEELATDQRFSLRLRPQNRKDARLALGFDLPERVGGIQGAGGRRALCLGPDEWLVETRNGDQPAFPGGMPHSLVDISDREVTWRISGPRAAELLSIGIARDLSALSPGKGCRTAFGTVQAVLVREREDVYTLSVWRSFAPHVAALLAIGHRELACGL